MIVVRIWRVTRKASGSRITESPLQRVMRIIIESGAIYSMSSLIVVIIVVIRSTALYIAADSVRPLFIVWCATSN
jgi:hypothetical protein